MVLHALAARAPRLARWRRRVRNAPGDQPRRHTASQCRWRGEAALTDAPAADAPAAPEASADAAADAGPCQLDAPFGAPAIIVTSTRPNGSATLAEDELTIYVDTLVMPSRQAIFVSKRAQPGDPFPAGSEITGPVASSADTYNAALSTDGLALVFTSNRSSPGEYRLYKASRANDLMDFGAATLLAGTVGAAAAVDLQPSLTSDGELWFISDRSNVGVQFDLFHAAAAGAVFATPAPAVGEVNSSSDEGKAVITRDGFRIFFASARNGAATGADIWTATRTTKSAEFSGAVRVTELDTMSNERPAWISPDSCRLYFSSDSSGTNQIYVASRPMN
jgi:hypothetical protein